VKTANTIAEAILQVLQNNNLTVVRRTDTTFGSDAQDTCFAIDCAVAAETALQGEHVPASTWRPSDEVHS
jgi:hypothetical protein